MSEEVLTGENGDPIQDDGDNATGSEKDSDREDEEEETNAGTAKLRALLELTRTQLESKTHQCEAAMAQNRVYAAKYEGLERSYQQEKALRRHTSRTPRECKGS